MSNTAISLYKDVKCKGYESYYSYRADVTENSYSIVDNTSNVTITFYMNAYGYSAGFSSYNSCQYGIWIDGTKKGGGQSAAKTVNSGSTYIKIGSWTGNVAHNTDGTKTITVGLTFKCSDSGYYSDSYLPCQNDGSTSYPSGTPLIWSMGEVKLTTIPRASTLTASNGTLGTAQTLTVTQYSTSFTHTIVAKCGTASTTLCTKSSSTSISYTPPISLASQNTTGTSVSVTFTITTYSGDTSIGSSTKTINCAMPASVKPSCSIAVSDNAEYYSTYGAYVQSQSEFKIVISATQSYGASIKSYKTTVDGSTYTESSFTTDVIKGSGTLTISCTVTDSRGRIGTATVDVAVLAYNSPRVSSLSAARCNADGTINEQGEYIKITFSAAVTSLNEKNTATYTVSYKKASESSASYADLTDYDNNYAVSSGTYVFEADTGSTYAITLEVSDNFGDDSKSTGAPTGFAIMHWKSDGTAVGIGKIAEHSHALDMGVPIYLNTYGLATDFYQFGSIDELEAKVLEISLQMPTHCVAYFSWQGSSTDTSVYDEALYNGIPFTGSHWFVEIRKLHNSNYGVVHMKTYTTGFSVRNIMSNGALQGWEWINPPMYAATEFRTTERWRGEVLYAKLISCGALPSNTVKQIEIGISNSQIKGIEAISISGDTALKIPSDGVSVTVNSSGYLVLSTSKAFSNYNTWVILKYTK